MSKAMPLMDKTYHQGPDNRAGSGNDLGKTERSRVGVPELRDSGTGGCPEPEETIVPG